MLRPTPRSPGRKAQGLALALLVGLAAAACGSNVEFGGATAVSNNRGAGGGADGEADGGGGGDATARPPVDSGRNKPGKPALQPQTVERTFAASDRQSGVLKFTPELGVLTQELTLANLYEATDKTFVQVDRPRVNKMYQQGNPGTPKAQSFMQADQGILDLVVVVDDSGSMKEEQTNLSTKLAPLLEYVKDSDWRINVVTTDPARGCSRALIKKGDADLDTKFKNAVNAGINGTGNEQGIRMAVEALACPTTMWTRAKSTVAVLIVSDEDNCSNDGSDCAGKDWNKPEYLLDHLSQTMGRKLGTEARVYGLFWIPGTACDTAAYRAKQYYAAVTATSGTAGSICDADYSATLREVSKDVATILKAQFTLEATPDAGTVKVKVNGVDKPAGWSVAGTVLTFTDIPPKGATIDVSYVVGSRPLLDRWPLGEVPAAGTLAVTVNGNAVPAADYSVDAAAKDLVFKAKPAADAQIAIVFRRDMPLVQMLDLGAPARGGKVTVTVDAVETTAFRYEPQGAGARVVFDAPPADAAVVKASFEAYRGKILDYPLVLVGDKLRRVEVVDAATGAKVDAKLDDRTLVVAAAEHNEGRRLFVRYRNEASGLLTLELPELPEPGSVEIETEGVACRDGQGITITGKRLDLACDFATAVEMRLVFSYRTAARRDYTLDEVRAPEAGSWTVAIDGQETKAFKRKGRTIRLDAAPAPEASVRVTYVLGGG